MSNRITAYTSPFTAALQGASNAAKTGGDILRKRDENSRREASHVEEIQRAQEAREERKRARDQEEAFQGMMGAVASVEANQPDLSPRHAEMLRAFSQITGDLSPTAARYGLGQVRGLIAKELEEEDRSQVQRMLENSIANGAIDETVAQALIDDFSTGELTPAEARVKVREAVTLQAAQVEETERRDQAIQQTNQVLDIFGPSLNPSELKELQRILAVESATGELDPDDLVEKFMGALTTSMQRNRRRAQRPPQEVPAAPQEPEEAPQEFEDPESDRVRYWPAEKQQELQGRIEEVIASTVSREAKQGAVEEMLEGLILPGAVHVMIARLIKESTPLETTLGKAQARNVDEDRAGEAKSGTAAGAQSGRSQPGRGGRQPEN